MAYTQSITAQSGRNFLLKLSNGASPTTYNTVTGLRATDLTFNTNPVDITTKTSGGWKELLPDGGVRDMVMTGSGIYDTGGTYLAQIANSALAPVILEAEIVSGAGDKFQGHFVVQSFKRSGNHDGAETFDITLASTGVVVYSAS